MPIYYFIREDHSVILSIHIGVVSDEEFTASYNALYEDAQFSTEYRWLVDLSAAESGVRSVAAIQTMVTLVQKWYEGGPIPRTAVIAPRDLSFGLARMYGALSDSVPDETLVFRDAQKATEWLGIPLAVLNEANQEARNYPQAR
jgi:hypothetical protein